MNQWTVSLASTATVDAMFKGLGASGHGMAEAEKKRGLLRRLLGIFWWGAKVGTIPARGTGKAIIFAARKAYPREEGESRGAYRRRMAKNGVKVSLWTGYIVALIAGGPAARALAKTAITRKGSKVFIEGARKLLGDGD